MIVAFSAKAGSGKDYTAAAWRYLAYKNEIEKGRCDWLHGTFDDFVNNRIGGYQPWVIKKFAHKLKVFIAIVLNISVEKLEDPEFKKSRLGKEWNRFFIWDQINKQKFSDISLYSHQQAIDYIASMRLKNCTVVEIPMTVRDLLMETATEGIRDQVHSDFWVNALMSEYKPPINYQLNAIKSDQQLLKQTSKWLITDLRFPNEVDAIKNRNGFIVRIDSNKNTSNNHYSETALDDYNPDFRIYNDRNKPLKYLLDQVDELMIGLDVLK